MSVVSNDKRAEFNKFLRGAKRREEAGALLEALDFYKKCAAIRKDDPKLMNKVEKLKKKIQASPLYKKRSNKANKASNASNVSTPAQPSPYKILFPYSNGAFESTTPLKNKKEDATIITGNNENGIIDLVESDTDDLPDLKDVKIEKIDRVLFDDEIVVDETRSPQIENNPSKPESKNEMNKVSSLCNESNPIKSGSTDLCDSNEEPSNVVGKHVSFVSHVDSVADNEIFQADKPSPVLTTNTNDFTPKDKSNDLETHSNNECHDEILDDIQKEASFEIPRSDSPTVYYDVTDEKANEINDKHSFDEQKKLSKDDIEDDNDGDESDILSPLFSSDFQVAYDGVTKENSPLNKMGRHENSDVKIGKLRIPHNLFEKLYDYQKEGVEWLWKVHNTKPSGGILCDDMGLGKTIQVSTFIIGLMRGKVIKKALIVVPLSIIHQWRDEVAKWAPGVPVQIYHGSAHAGIPGRRSGVWITTYGMVLNRIDQLSDERIVWDYVVLDEGHTIKNYNAMISQRVRLLNSKRRLVMTGTPITNNLQELWSLMDWACQGKLLGDKKDFEIEFEDRIIRGSDKNASDFEKELGSKIAESLRKLIEPHVLRREKKDYLAKALTSSQRSATAISSNPDKIYVRKNDLVVWIKLTEIQCKVYKMFLESEEVKEIFNSTKSPLAAIGVLQKICCHPSLLNETTKTIEKLDLSFLHEKNLVVENSSKIIFLISLLHKLIEDGHRTLIFSRSVMMLNIIEDCLNCAGITSSRIDGSYKIEERQNVISYFTENKSINCFLLTTQVGAVGLNLVAADRVVIFDPSWSILDDQAVDRVYRIGQKKDVVIYRLITCGTVEEKVYRRQVFKQALMRTAMEEDSAYRYFTKQELRDVLILENPETSITQNQISVLHKGQRKSYPDLDANIKFIEEQEYVYGVSDHDLLFTVKNRNICLDDMSELNKRVDKAVHTITNNKGNKVRPNKKIVVIGDDDDDDDSNDIKYINSNDDDNNNDNGNNKVNSKIFVDSISSDNGIYDLTGIEDDEDENKSENKNTVENDDPISSDEEDYYDEARKKYRSFQPDKVKRRLVHIYPSSDNDKEQPPTKRIRGNFVDGSSFSDSDEGDTEKDPFNKTCKMHRDSAKSFNIKRCRCYLTLNNKRRFNKLLREMNDSINKGSELEALKKGFDLLSLCDDSSSLQALIWNMGNKLFEHKTEK